jgi:hypothetical protein
MILLFQMIISPKIQSRPLLLFIKIKKNLKKIQKKNIRNIQINNYKNQTVKCHMINHNKLIIKIM